MTLSAPEKAIRFKEDMQIYRVLCTFNGNYVASCATSASMAYRIQQMFWHDLFVKCPPHLNAYAKDASQRPSGLKGRILTLTSILAHKVGEYSAWQYTDETGAWACWIERIN